jgi:hypothetical protein
LPPLQIGLRLKQTPSLAGRECVLVRLTLRTEMSVSRGEDMSRAPIHSIELEAQRKELDLAMLRARSATGATTHTHKTGGSPHSGLILEIRFVVVFVCRGLCCCCHVPLTTWSHKIRPPSALAGKVSFFRCHLCLPG